MSIKGTAESYVEMRGSLSVPDMITGKSAYEIALLNGFEGTEAEWLASLKGEKGDKGTGASVISTEYIGQDENGGNIYMQTFDDGSTSTFTAPKGVKGDKGDQGDIGNTGVDGTPCTHYWDGTTLYISSASGESSADLKGEKGDKGDRGEQGIQGEQGVQGEQGNRGEKGEQGEQGDPGIVDYNVVYPIGSIYMSTKNVSPASFIGGSWTKIENAFLLGASSKYSAGSTGGSADAVLINHVHSIYDQAGNKIRFGTTGNSWGYNVAAGSYASTGTDVTMLAGNPEGGVSDGTGKNMPPYLAVYMWKRTA